MMAFWKNLKIGTKIYIGFGIMLLALAGLFGAGYLALTHSSESTFEMADTNSEALDTTNLDAEVASLSGLVTEFSLTFDPNILKQAQDEAAVVRQVFDKTKANITDDQYQSALGDIKATLDNYLSNLDTLAEELTRITKLNDESMDPNMAAAQDSLAQLHKLTDAAALGDLPDQVKDALIVSMRADNAANNFIDTSQQGQDAVATSALKSLLDDGALAAIRPHLPAGPMIAALDKTETALKAYNQAFTEAIDLTKKSDALIAEQMVPAQQARRCARQAQKGAAAGIGAMAR